VDPSILRAEGEKPAGAAIPSVEREERPGAKNALTTTSFKCSIECMNTRTHRAFKDQVFAELARVPKALASPKRLELVDLLAQSERGVEELSELTGMSVANTSQHLQILRRALLVNVRREGAQVHYRLADEAVFRASQALRDLGERRSAELDRVVRTFRVDRDVLETVSADELLRRMRKDSLVVLDVRPAAEYRSGHIVGARSMPIRELQRRLAELPKRSEVVAYCRGPFCVYADEAVALLRRRGFRARRLTTGFPDWKAAGLPVAAEETP
jgi:rhodanese-related sulfurtransferase